MKRMQKLGWRNVKFARLLLMNHNLVFSMSLCNDRKPENLPFLSPLCRDSKNSFFKRIFYKFDRFVQLFVFCHFIRLFDRQCPYWSNLAVSYISTASFSVISIWNERESNSAGLSEIVLCYFTSGLEGDYGRFRLVIKLRFDNLNGQNFSPILVHFLLFSMHYR